MSWFFNLQDTLFSFLEKGGGVVLIISFLVVLMWFFIFERIWYFRFVHPAVEKETIEEWSKVSEHKSWKGHMVRAMLISKANLKIKSNLELIRVSIAIAPLLGLFGTIVGMIEVFHILAVTGGGDAKAMAGGVSRSTIPAMAGLAVALTGTLANQFLVNKAQKEKDLLVDQLVAE